MEKELTAFLFLLLSITILVFTYIALKISKLILVVQQSLGIEDTLKKHRAIEHTISFGELILLTGLAIAFLQMPKIAGFLILTGLLLTVISLSYLWFLELFSEAKTLNKNKEER